jgi:hypothetical protein
MARSTSLSQISTLPRLAPWLGSTGSTKSTFSPSPDTMPTMTWSGVKMREAMLSKHLLRCGCTAVAFLVCERMLSNSSLERK